MFVKKPPMSPLGKAELKILAEFQQTAAERRLVPVITHERLFGYPLNGGIDRMDILTRIRESIHRPKVLLVFREQRSWMLSMFKQMANHGDLISLAELAKPRNQPKNSPTARWKRSYLDFFLARERLSDIFGPQNVLLYPHELLNSDFQGFSSRLSTFVEKIASPAEEKLREVNPAQPLWKANIKHSLNRTLFRPASNGTGIYTDEKTVEIIKALRRATFRAVDRVPNNNYLYRQSERKALNFLDAQLGSFYEESNSLLARELRLDLGKLGYAIC